MPVSIEPLVNRIDWLASMRVQALGEPELFDGRLPDAWIVAQCRKAAVYALTECPRAIRRLRDGRLSDDVFAGVVCDMVLRMARQYRYKLESSGNYQYQRPDPQPVDSTGYDPSPKLYLTKADRTLLNGGSQSASYGHFTMNLDRGYGA